MFNINNIKKAYIKALEYINYPIKNIDKYIQDKNNSSIVMACRGILHKDTDLKIAVLNSKGNIDKNFKPINVGNIDDILIDNIYGSNRYKDYNVLLQKAIFQKIEGFNKHLDLLEDTYNNGGLMIKPQEEIRFRNDKNNALYCLSTNKTYAYTNRSNIVIDVLANTEEEFFALVKFIKDILYKTGYDFWANESIYTKSAKDIISRYIVLRSRAEFEREKIFSK